jgi:hypothetical protein
MNDAIERERDKLLHVAELLERGAYEFDERRYRVFGAMAKRIRRFWGAAVQIVPDDRVRELIETKVRLLNCRRKGVSFPCDPMSELAILREVLALRQENCRLKQCGLPPVVDATVLHDKQSEVERNEP